MLHCTAFIFCLLRIMSHYAQPSTDTLVPVMPHHLDKPKNKTGTLQVSEGTHIVHQAERV
jgi:hypothetical protein